MTRPLSVLAALIMLHFTAIADPISPRPLRKLITEAELIIQGKVIFTGVENVPNSVYDINYALIEVKEVIQGRTNDDTLKVRYFTNIVSPEPPVYLPGEELIAFLDKDKKTGSYNTHALSYGVKHFTDKEGILIYKQRILEMQFINILANGREKNREMVEWMVRCATSKYTRWEGLYELSPQSYFISDFENEYTRNESFLTTEQRRRIFDALITAEALSYAEIGLIDIAIGVDDDKLLAKLKRTIGAIKSDNPQLVIAMMERVIKLTGDIKLEQLYDEYMSGFRMTKKNSSKYRSVIFEQFKRNMEGVEVKRIVWGWGDDLV